jgi:hypothetical protein
MHQMSLRLSTQQHLSLPCDGLQELLDGFVSQYVRGDFSAAADKKQTTMETDGDESAKTAEPAEPKTEATNGATKSNTVMLKVGVSTRHEEV